MFVGALCHDLDHRGFNNKFMIDVGSPLAAIYSTSTMEHHHFNMAINILQQEQQNIFSRLSPDEYKQVLGNMKHCILATDLALFFPNKVVQPVSSSLLDSLGAPQHPHPGKCLQLGAAPAQVGAREGHGAAQIAGPGPHYDRGGPQQCQQALGGPNIQQP